MDVAHQLEQVGLLLAQDGLVAVMTNLADAPMPPVESSGISAQQPLHDGLDRHAAAPQQQMEVVGDQRPCVTNTLAFFQHTPETPKELLSIAIVPKNLPPLDPPADDVLQRTRCVDARSSWHVSPHTTELNPNKVVFSAPSVCDGSVYPAGLFIFFSVCGASSTPHDYLTFS
jgi:hypothetical protein